MHRKFKRNHRKSSRLRRILPKIRDEKLQVGKENVSIQNIVPVGNYAIQILYDDGHDTGIYSWEYLYELGCAYEDKWNSYLQKLKEAGYERVKQ